MVDICEEYHEKLMDAVTALDDDLAMMYLEGEEIPVEKIKAVIRKATIDNEMVPIVCGTSYKNKGVQELLDAVVDYMPSPLDKKGIRGINPETEEEDFRPLPTMHPSPLWPSRSLPTPTWASCATSACTPVRWRRAPLC